MHIGTRVLILAAGSGERWANHLGVPKHLIDIDGERLVQRTARQFSKYVTEEVTVVGPEDERYFNDYATHYTPRANLKTEIDKFLSSMLLWGDQNVVLVFGDVYFTDEAVETIMTHSGDWTFFCRPSGSEITGKNWREIYAFFVPPHNRRVVRDAIKRLSLVDVDAGGWALFRKLVTGNHNKTNEADKAIFKAGHHVVIDDLTEDFDYPSDYDNWLPAKNSLT
jgi:hypothetical protein